MQVSHATLRITFLDYWHCGSGLGRGGMLDAVCIRDPLGLPNVPGRTVKGLLRHALTASLAYQGLPLDLVEKLFGTDGFEAGVARSDTVAGGLRVSSAVLPAAVADRFRQIETDEKRGALAAALFRPLRMTAINGATGVAAAKSLRAIEVAVPLVLDAHVEATSAVPDEWLEHLRLAAPLVRAVGAHKSRGLGRAACALLTRPGVSA